MDHIGPAHSVGELEVLRAAAGQRMVGEGQDELDFGDGRSRRVALPVRSSRARYLWDVLSAGFTAVGLTRPLVVMRCSNSSCWLGWLGQPANSRRSGSSRRRESPPRTIGSRGHHTDSVHHLVHDSPPAAGVIVDPNAGMFSDGNLKALARW